MKFLADLHVHSRFSRATSKTLTISELDKGAAKKGIKVLGTGDFTHPLWSKELEENLAPAEPGLMRLKGQDTGIRFLLTAEISTIYKQGVKVRKVHHLLGAPTMDAIHKISAALAQRGNIISDGRPILGITSRDLLEIVLEADDNAFLIPAHIWTPWFSALGSKSGFDSIRQCYGDLEPYIFAVETGLSSDPPMNWQVSSLDRYHLVSNSDAHSTEKIGREATIFDAELDYFSMLDALKTGQGLSGTIEFFPEEGKYHLDGHRTCDVALSPEETKGLGGICPVCGKPLTIGVLNRVMALSDREEGKMPDKARPFYSLIPLAEILGEIMHVGPTSIKVRSCYDRLVRHFGGELPLLLDVDLDEIKEAAGDVLALAISRMRSCDVEKQPGFDGKFGKIKIFHDLERDGLFKDMALPFDIPKKRTYLTKAVVHEASKDSVLKLNKDQRHAVGFGQGYLIVKAGPGTGKTRVLVERVRQLIQQGIEHRCILAITFTTKVAQEIKDRLGMNDLDIYTFHALAAKILHKAGLAFEIADEPLLVKRAMARGINDPRAFVSNMILHLSTQQGIEKEEQKELDDLRRKGLYPFEGLIMEAIRIIDASRFLPIWDHIMVDEFQDINPMQYHFLRALGKRAKSIMVIGDPNQAIYGFRGSHPHAFDAFFKDFPEVAIVELKDTYRLNTTIAGASNVFIGRKIVVSSKQGPPIKVVKTTSPSFYIAKEVDALAGGLSHSTVGKAKAEYSLGDIAVIVRTSTQAEQIADELKKASIPFESAYARPFSEIDSVAQRITILEDDSWIPLVKGVGEKALERMKAGFTIDRSVAERIRDAENLIKSLSGSISDRLDEIERSGLFKLSKIDKSHDFYKYAQTFGSDVNEFIKWCKLSNDQGALTGEKVRVLTAHAAKGLEFGCVFITGLAQGVFPLANGEIAEERNLFYVAITRALDHLYLVCSPARPSEFLGKIPPEYISSYEDKFQHRAVQLHLFDQPLHTRR
ncbi:MAG: UvrD-helicase domain-containing protein [Deltaproteobacteria bacterium]|nr:UvrD-helicase domain-containing protein [Deltaproteobacteria bacterium]